MLCRPDGISVLSALRHMGRLLSAGSIVRAQADFFLPAASVNRITGLTAAGLTLKLFADNAAISWPLVDGSTVADSSISAGTVYFNEISGSPGFYSVRLFPDRIGFWRVILTNVSIQTERILELDIVPSGKSGQTGLIATFLKT